MSVSRCVKQNIVHQVFKSRWSVLLIAGCLFAGISGNVFVWGKPLPEKRGGVIKNTPPLKADQPLVQFLKLKSPANDVTLGNITNIALELQNRSSHQNRDAILVLEITPGTSQFHHIRSMAKFLTSSKLSRVRTVAWIPETVTGNNVVLALACKEIIMHPDAQLGDIGRGEKMDEIDKNFIRSIADKRHNRKVNVALVNGMLDSQTRVFKIKIQGKQQGEETESRVVSAKELKRLRDNRVAITDVVTVKEAGELGLLTGSKSRALDLLVVQTAESLAELATIYKIPRSALRENFNSIKTPIVKLIQLNGEINPLLEQFIARQIDRAVAAKANTIVFEIDSPGGYFLTSQNLADRILELKSKEIKTVAYIPKMAFSGAALISLACDEIYLSPTAKIGDIGMIVNDGNGAYQSVPAKMLSPLRISLRNLGKEKGRPPSLLESMCDKDLNVYEVTSIKTGQVWYLTENEIHASNGEWKKGLLVHESRNDNFLTLDSARAHELKITEAPVKDITELKIRLGLPADAPFVAIERTWIDNLIFVLNTPFMTGVLFFAGIVLIYIEMHFTSGLFGIGAVVCFAVFFWSKFLGGTAGWLEVVLFLLGLILIALELFVIPGFGVTGVSGGLLVVASLIMASQTFGNLEPYADMQNLSRSMGTLMGSFVAVIVFAMLLNKFLPNMPFMKSIILSPPGAEALAGGPRIRPEFLDLNSPESTATSSATFVGDVGTTRSILRPSGKVQFRDKLLDVVSNGPYIQKNCDVEVIEIAGNHVVVQEITQDDNNA